MIPIYYSVRSLWVRRLSTGLTVLGLALVVFVFAAVLMLSHGIQAALASGGSPLNVVVLRDGATNEIVSLVSRDAVRILSTAPQVAASREGQPLAAGEWLVLVSLPREGGHSNITVRGIQDNAFALRPSVVLVEGRRPRPGTNEVVVGSAIGGHIEGATVGGALSFANQVWPVVGRFAAQGSAYDSEIWANGDRIGAAFDRPDFSSATFRVRSIDQVSDFARRVDEEVRFTLKAEREDVFWEEQATGLATFIRVLGLFVALVFSVGAALGAMITMYAQVSARLRELAMLRAVGFRRRTVLGTVVVESMVLGAAGGVLGCLCALGLRWLEFRTLNFQTFSEVRFEFIPTPAILAGALLFGIALGLAGGALPARRAARLSILDALR